MGIEARPRAKNTPNTKRKLIIGRDEEIRFFTEEILDPDIPNFNIISISGEGGVGKTTLIERFIEEAKLKEHCITAHVDERQISPISIMETFAQQLREADCALTEFESAVKSYKEYINSLNAEHLSNNEDLTKNIGNMAAHVIKETPVVGEMLQTGTKLAIDHYLRSRRYRQLVKNAQRAEDDPILTLTKAFIKNINDIVKSNKRRLVLFFDTFERLAPEASIWLLDYFYGLEVNINYKIVVIIAGREPLERTIPDSPKDWLEHTKADYTHTIHLGVFNRDQTIEYLSKFGIEDNERIETIWNLSKGLPLWLALLTTDPAANIDPTESVVDNYLKWIPENETTKKRLAMEAVLFTKPFNLEDFIVFDYIKEEERERLFKWLISQPFIRNNLKTSSYIYHDLVKEHLIYFIFHNTPQKYLAVRKTIANYYNEYINKLILEYGKKLQDITELLNSYIEILLLIGDKPAHINCIERIAAIEGNDGEKDVLKYLQNFIETESASYLSKKSLALAKNLIAVIELNCPNPQKIKVCDNLLQEVQTNGTNNKRILGWLYYSRGHTYRHNDRYDEAITDLENALKYLPKFSSIFVDLALIYADMQESEKGLDYISRAIELNPNSPYVYKSQIEVLNSLDKFDEVEKCLHILAKKGEDVIWILKEKGDLECRKGDMQKAVSYYTDAINQGGIKKYPRLYSDRAHAYLHAKYYAEAIADFLSSIELRSRHSHYFCLAQAYIGIGQKDKAIETYKSAIIDNSSLSNRAEAFLELGEYSAALDDLNNIAEIDQDEHYYYLRGVTHLWRGELKKARVDLKAAFGLDREFTGCAFLAEWVEWVINKPTLAEVSSLESIMINNPDGFTELIYDGLCFWFRHEYTKALAKVQKAYNSVTDIWGTNFWLGFMLAASNQHTEAKIKIDKALELGLPVILLKPLLWLKTENPNFYSDYVEKLFQKYNLG